MIKNTSLKWALIFSIILAMAVPLLITGGIFTRILANNMKQQIISANESLSYSFIDQIETYLNTALDDLKTLRTMVEKQDFEMLNHTSLLDSIRKNKHYFTRIQIINRQGYTRFISPHSRHQINLDMSQNPIYTEPMRTGTPYWSPAFITQDTGSVAVSISIPFENGVMAGFLSLEHLSQAAANIAHGKKIHITITDQSSSYIAHYRDSLVFQRGFDPNYKRIRDAFQGRLISETRILDNIKMFVTAGMIPRTDWAIVFSQPVENVFYPIRLFYIYMISGLVFLITITTLLCLRHINLVISTLKRFTRSARGIAEGRYDKEQVAVRYKEFSSLSQQFNSMARSIQTRELALKENEEKYRSIFTAAQDAILLVDEKDLKILDVNDFACNLYQYSRDEFLSLYITQLCSSPLKMERALHERKSWISETRHRKKDRSLFSVELSIAFHLQGNTHTICTIVARNITQRIAQEKEKETMQGLLAQAQKMEAVGRLAGGIAHDFNNILTAIVGFAEMSRTKSPEGSPLAQYNTHVLQAAQRAKELVNQILSFARTSGSEKKPVQVNRILTEVVKFIRASIPSSIEIKTQIQSELWVMADPIQLHQVIMNLCTNAWHAMKKEGGTLTLSLSPLTEEKSFGQNCFEKGKALLLSVEDTGRGIAPENLNKIFDPYFTTKMAGEGSGMGLSVVQGIIRGMEGQIEVESTLFAGSSFRIFLPTIPASTPIEKTDTEKNIRGDESILIVDDEPEITRAMGLMLESLGYKVTTENDPIAALAEFQKSPDKFDLVISDMTMPGMGGDQLAQEIFEIRPNMSLIVCTGFHETMTPAKAEEMGIKKFLYKPVEKAVLGEAVRGALD